LGDTQKKGFSDFLTDYNLKARLIISKGQRGHLLLLASTFLHSGSLQRLNLSETP
jgi:hypothetical protein